VADYYHSALASKLLAWSDPDEQLTTTQANTHSAIANRVAVAEVVVRP
jgi:hypothetical protein